MSEPSDVYSGLAEVDRLWLGRAAESLQARLRSTITEVLQAGGVLAAARRRLGRGRWAPWLAGCAGVPKRSASRMISVHAAFGKSDPEVLGRFTPSALYALAESGVPQSLREYAVEQAGDGASVTLALVGEWLDAYRDPCTGAPVSLARKDEPKQSEEVDPLTVWAGDNWLRLVGVLAPGVSLYLTASEDAENGEPLVSATLIGHASRRVVAQRGLEACVLELSGKPREKVCKRCKGGAKPLDQFSYSKSFADGRNKYCLKCEQQRVKAYARRKSGGKPSAA